MSNYAIVAKNLQLVLGTKRTRAMEGMRGQERNKKQKSNGEKTTRAGEDTTPLYHVLYMCRPSGRWSKVCMVRVTAVNGEFNLV